MATALRQWGRRTLSRRNRAGAWLAILTCPCHGAVVLYLAAGTAFGSVLLAYRTWMYAALAAAFVAGLWLMIRPDANVCTLEGQAREDTGAARGDRRASSTSARTGGEHLGPVREQLTYLRVARGGESYSSSRRGIDAAQGGPWPVAYR